MPNAKNVDELRKLMRESMEEQAANAYQMNCENAILDKVLNECSVEPTEEEIEKAVDLTLQMMARNMAMQGIQFDQYLQMTGTTKEQLADQVRPNALKQAEFEVIIDEIVKLENIVVTEEMIEEQLKALGDANHMERDEVIKHLNMDDFKRDLGRMEASKVILSTAKVNN